MMIRFFRSMSLKTRVITVVAVLIVAGMWSLAARVAAVLHADLEQVLSEQLSATVGYIADDLDRKFKLRIDTLNEIAATITPDILADPARIQRLLEQRRISSELFPIGVGVRNTEGIYIAEYPRVAGRLGSSMRDRDLFQEIMTGGKRAVGKPMLGRFANRAFVGISAPLHDASGAVQGVLTGPVYLSDPNLFGLLEQTKIGKGGLLVVASPRDRLWVSSNDNSRILQRLPAKGLNPVLDRRMEEGFEGAVVATASYGVQILGVSRNMKTTGWVVIASVPTSEVFAPATALKHQIYLAALLISLVIMLVLRFVLARQLAPLEEAGTAMSRMTTGAQSFAPLPVHRDDEIGRLLTNFNRLITERSSLDAARRDAEERFRDLAQLASDWFWEQDASLRFTAMSEEIYSKAHLRPESTIGKHRWELPIVGVSSDQWQVHRALLERHEPFRNFVYQMINEAGEKRWFSIDGKPVFGPDGEFRGYRGTGRDITESKRSEEARARLAAIVESSTDAIISRALDGTILSWNAGAERLFGYSANEAVGQPITIIVPPDQHISTKDNSRLLQGGGQIPMTDVVRLTKDGRRVDVMRSLSPVRNEAGEISSVAIIMRDVTERKAAEEEIRRLNMELEQRVAERTAQLEATVEELEAAAKEMESFTYTVAHDLRSPLRAMHAFSTILVDDYGTAISGEGRGYLERVINNAQRMGNLIDDLLDFSRYGRQPMQKHAVDVSALVKTVVAEQVPGDAKVEVRLGNLPSCQADSALLRQVWVNLISNAIKYSHPVASPVVEIGYAEGAYFVRDNGVGFDMEHADKLFGVFSRLHRTEDFEGTGVGLAIVKRIVERHGGRVWAQAKVGKGATFFFSLG